MLDLAERGKLVEQDPADEPASQLLKRIAAEKERPVMAGKAERVVICPTERSKIRHSTFLPPGAGAASMLLGQSLEGVRRRPLIQQTSPSREMESLG